MQLIESPRVQDWLSLFEPQDVDAAVLLVNSLTVIDTDAQDADLRRLITGNYRSKKLTVAAFAVREVDGGGDPYFDRGRPRAMADPQTIGSEGRIARLIRDVAAECDWFLAHPTFELMTAARPSVILLVDDFSGSGQRLVSFARWLFSDARIKSLHSYGKIRFHAIAAITTAVARDRLQKEPLIAKFSYERFARTFSSHWKQRAIRDEMRAFAVKYGKRTNRRHLSLGYRDTESLSLLSDHCPNNVPAIFWAVGRAWRPLFPNGKVPEDVYLLLLDGDRVTLEERLRLDRDAYLSHETGGGTSLFGKRSADFLRASTRFRAPLDRFEQLAMTLGISISEVALLSEHAQLHGFVDTHGRLTEAGRFELDRLKSQVAASRGNTPQAARYYFPKSLRHQA